MVKKYSVTKAFKELSRTNKKQESGKYTEQQYNKRTKKILRKLVITNN